MTDHTIGYLNDPDQGIKKNQFSNRLDSIRAIIFLFHGRGGNGHAIQQALGQYVLVDDVLIVAPTAASGSRHPHKFDVPVTQNQPWLDSAINWIHQEVMSLVNTGHSLDKILIGGFSQGGCLALEYALRYPQRYGGIFGLSCGVIGRLGQRNALNARALQDTPIFLGCNEFDSWVPREKFAVNAHFFSIECAQN